MNAEGIIEGVYIGFEPQVSEPVEAIAVVQDGIRGDRHSGQTRLVRGYEVRSMGLPKGTEVRNLRQITIVSKEELAEAAAALGIPEIRPESVSANISVSGIEGLTQVPPTSTLRFEHGVVIMVTGENSPCSGAGQAIAEQVGDTSGDLAARFPKAAFGKRGLVAITERSGTLRAGETVRFEPPRRYQ